jgi:3-carboxy-cis,cis-muconate cycloisomerase
MTQQGLEDITLSGGGGSSAMPHKQNPVSAELLITLARFNATQVSAMHHALIHEQERSGAAWSLEWMVLPQMLMATGKALDVGCALCKSITGLGKA